MSLSEEFREIIDGKLKRAGIPRSHYADWLDVSPPAVTAMLNGTYQDGISFQRAERWALALGLRLRLVAEEIPE
jgi:Mn-dependent DtxR family transcriptional regulator